MPGRIHVDAARNPRTALRGSLLATLRHVTASSSGTMRSLVSGGSDSHRTPRQIASMVVRPACVGEVEQRHRGHRVLMDAVDRVALDDITRPRVVVPPPLARVALGCADTSCDGGRGLECLGVVRALVQPCECLDGIDLVGEAADMRAVRTAAAHHVGVEGTAASGEQACRARGQDPPPRRRTGEPRQAPTPSRRCPPRTREAARPRQLRSSSRPAGYGAGQHARCQPPPSTAGRRHRGS